MDLSFVLYALIAQRGGQPQHDPIVVKIIEPPTDPTGLAEVLLGVVRLTGVWVLVAAVAGGLLAYGLFWFRSRDNDSGMPPENQG